MVRLQDDFYDYVNGKWAETAVIPDDKPSTGGVYGLDQEIENLMLDITGKWQRGRLTRRQHSPKKLLSNTTRWWQIFEARDAAGVAPAMPMINEIKALSSLKTIPVSWAPMS